MVVQEVCIWKWFCYVAKILEGCRRQDTYFVATSHLCILLVGKSPKTPQMYWYVGISNIAIKKYVNISNIKIGFRHGFPTYLQKGGNWMSQDKLALVKKFRLSPREASMLADKAQQANMTESEYLRLMIFQKPKDYLEIRILLRELINEVNHIGTNINQIVHNYNSGMYSEDDKERLVAYMCKLNTEVNNVY